MKFYNEILDLIIQKGYLFKIRSEKSFAFVYEDKAFIIMQNRDLPNYILSLIMSKVFMFDKMNIRKIAEGISIGFNRSEPLIKTIIGDNEVYLSTHLVENPNKEIFEAVLYRCLNNMIDISLMFADKMEFMIEQDMKDKNTTDKQSLLDMVYDFTSQN